MKRDVYGGFIAAMAVLMLAACGRSIPVKPQPFPAQCSAECRVPCVDATGDTGVRIQGDPAKASTFDEIGETAGAVLGERLRQCDVHRKACVQCLDRLERAGVIAR